MTILIDKDNDRDDKYRLLSYLIGIRVVLFRKLKVGLLNITLGCTLGNTKHFVKVSLAIG